MADTLAYIVNELDTLVFFGTKPISIINSLEPTPWYIVYLPSVIAIITTALLVYNQIKKPKIFGKIISLTTDLSPLVFPKVLDKNEAIYIGQLFYLKVVLSVYKKDLYFREVNVFATIEGKRIKGEIFWINPARITFNGEPFKYSIPHEKFLSYNSVIVKDSVNSYYLNFIILKRTEYALFEKIELEFIKPNKKKQRVELRSVDDLQFFFDRTLYTPMHPERDPGNSC